MTLWSRYPDRGADRVVRQVLSFVALHRTRMGLHYHRAEQVRSVAAAGSSALLPSTVWVGDGGARHPAVGLAKLGGGLRDAPTHIVLEQLKGRALTLGWLEEVEAVTRIFTMLGGSATIFRREHEAVFADMMQRLMDCATVACALMQAVPCADTGSAKRDSVGTDTVGTLARRPAGGSGGTLFPGAMTDNAAAAAAGTAVSKQPSRASARTASRHRTRTRSRADGGTKSEPEPESDASVGSDGAPCCTDLFRGARPDGSLQVGRLDSGQQLALATTVHQGLLVVLRNAMQCLRAVSPRPVPGISGHPVLQLPGQTTPQVRPSSSPKALEPRAAFGRLALPPIPLTRTARCGGGVQGGGSAQLPTLRSLQQLTERLAERRFVWLLREQASPLASYPQGGADSLYRSVSFQLNAELAEMVPSSTEVRAINSERVARLVVTAESWCHAQAGRHQHPWWKLVDNDPEALMEKMDMVLGLLQIFDKADADGNGKLDEGETKELLRMMFDDDRENVIEDTWRALLKRIERNGDGPGTGGRGLRGGGGGGGGRGEVSRKISQDDWVHAWLPPSDPAATWEPMCPHVVDGHTTGGITPRGVGGRPPRETELASMFRLTKRADVYRVRTRVRGVRYPDSANRARTNVSHSWCVRGPGIVRGASQVRRGPSRQDALPLDRSICALASSDPRLTIMTRAPTGTPRSRLRKARS
jgi:hypothetical protein